VAAAGQACGRALLAESYGWFTAGFDTAGLQEAQALRAELGDAGVGVPLSAPHATLRKV
jgi:hypothetical protein